MTVFACALHWYASAMFVVPTAAVGAWSWWSSRRVNRQDDDNNPGRGTGSREVSPSPH